VDGFTVNRKTGELSWQHFDEGDGLKLRMVYVDQEMRNIILEGYSVNTTILNGQELGKQHNEQVQANKSIIYIMGAGSAFLMLNRSIHCYKTDGG
jgi:hypothetical protein